MPRKKSPHLTDAELRLMEVLWRNGPSTVSDVVAGLPKSVPLAYSTVLTTLRVLENKGYLRHVKEERAFIYRPLIAREQAQQIAVRHLVDRFFGGSPELLMLHLVEQVNAKELARLKQK